MYPKNTTTSLEIKKKLKFIPHEVRAEGPSVADVNNFVKMCIAHGKLSVDHTAEAETRGFFSS